jgi:hypothetical protein
MPAASPFANMSQAPQMTFLDNQQEPVAPQFAPIAGNTNNGTQNATSRELLALAATFNASPLNDLHQLFKNHTLSNNQKTASARYLLAFLDPRPVQKRSLAATADSPGFAGGSSSRRTAK